MQSRMARRRALAAKAPGVIRRIVARTGRPPPAPVEALVEPAVFARAVWLGSAQRALVTQWARALAWLMRMTAGCSCRRSPAAPPAKPPIIRPKLPPKRRSG